MSHILETGIVNNQEIGFDGEKYIKLQTDALRERLATCSWKLYVEVGWGFLQDEHAARILPGYVVDSKYRVFGQFGDDLAVICCASAQDAKQLADVLDQARSIEQQMKIKPSVVINRVDRADTDVVDEVRRGLESEGFLVSYRYEIADYGDVSSVVSGLVQDDYVQTDAKLVLVTGGSNSGKISTCLWQVAHDQSKGLVSGYAKYETFPVWNLELEHPINLAYEAAVADTNDFGCVDFAHEEYYNQSVTNYNRDVESFPWVMDVARAIVSDDNHMLNYHSPTDMGINRIGFAITDERVCAEASLQEIIRRRDAYQSAVESGSGDQVWVEDCERLVAQAKEWFM